jgi:hypothetical protein
VTSHDSVAVHFVDGIVLRSGAAADHDMEAGQGQHLGDFFVWPVDDEDRVNSPEYLTRVHARTTLSTIMGHD